MAKYCVVFLFISLWHTIIAGENQYFCFMIVPDCDLKVTGAGLSWGKWVNGIILFNEVPGPSPGEVIKANSARTICSSGRKLATSGTEGYVGFKDEHNKQITVKWNNPWGAGHAYSKIEIDEKIFSYSGSSIRGPWNLRYDIYYNWPNTPHLSENINYEIPWSCFYYDTCLKNSCDKNSCRVRRDVSDNDDDDDDDSFCDSSDGEMDADCNDHLLISNIYKGVTNADIGTVDGDVARFEQDYPPVHVPYDADHPAAIRQYSTVYFPALDLNLPIVVRARVNSKTVAEAKGNRNPSGIKEAAKELTEALKRVKTHDGLSYHVGHMIAWALGGPDAAYNFAPQTEFLNLGQYKKMENNVRKFVNDHPEGWVDMTVLVYYWQDTFMPVAFGVNLVYYFTHGVLASNCRDTLFWNQRPYPPNPPSIG